MRSNSGKGEARNNLDDPAMRDCELGRHVDRGKVGGRTTELGSNARQSGQQGDEDRP